MFLILRLRKFPAAFAEADFQEVLPVICASRGQPFENIVVAGFNEEQIVAVLKEAKAGVPIGELCRRLDKVSTTNRARYDCECKENQIPI